MIGAMYALARAPSRIKRATILHGWLITLTLTWLGTVGTIAYYFWLEKPWLEYQHTPWDVIYEPHAGEPVGILVFRCNTSGTPKQYNISHTLVKLDPPFSDACPETTILKPGLVPIKVGCLGPERSDANVTSPDTCPGTYIVEGDAEVPGTVRTTYVHWKSKPFHVYPPKGKP